MRKSSLLQILQKNIDILKMDVKIPCLWEFYFYSFEFNNQNNEEEEDSKLLPFWLGTTCLPPLPLSLSLSLSFILDRKER